MMKSKIDATRFLRPTEAYGAKSDSEKNKCGGRNKDNSRLIDDGSFYQKAIFEEDPLQHPAVATGRTWGCQLARFACKIQKKNDNQTKTRYRCHPTWHPAELKPRPDVIAPQCSSREKSIKVMRKRVCETGNGGKGTR